MLVSVLASGSKGNSCLIKTQTHNILIDAGMTCKYLEIKIIENNLTLKDIDYVIITHTHTDHVNGLSTLIKKCQPTIIMSPLMLADLKFLENYKNIMFIEENLTLDNVLIESIKTSHDTTDSRAYIVTEAEASVVVLTDTGYVNQKLWAKLTNKSVYVFESNHDVEMLMHGRYPKWLKKRVCSTVGHLSNEASAFYLSRLIGPSTKQIILAHLSGENNTSEIALANLRSCFAEHGIIFNNMITAPQSEKTEPIEI